MRTFNSLSEREILALAISLEEEDARIYADFAEGLTADSPQLAQEFDRMRAEEDQHRHRLLELYRRNFGEHIPLLRRHAEVLPDHADDRDIHRRENVGGHTIDAHAAQHGDQ